MTTTRQAEGLHLKHPGAYVPPRCWNCSLLANSSSEHLNLIITKGKTLRGPGGHKAVTYKTCQLQTCESKICLLRRTSQSFQTCSQVLELQNWQAHGLHSAIPHPLVGVPLFVCSLSPEPVNSSWILLSTAPGSYRQSEGCWRQTYVPSLSFQWWRNCGGLRASLTFMIQVMP